MKLIQIAVTKLLVIVLLLPVFKLLEWLIFERNATIYFNGENSWKIILITFYLIIHSSFRWQKITNKIQSCLIIFVSYWLIKFSIQNLYLAFSPKLLFLATLISIFLLFCINNRAKKKINN